MYGSILFALNAVRSEDNYLIIRLKQRGDQGTEKCGFPHTARGIKKDLVSAVKNRFCKKLDQPLVFSKILLARKFCPFRLFKHMVFISINSVKNRVPFMGRFYITHRQYLCSALRSYILRPGSSFPPARMLGNIGLSTAVPS